MNCVTIVDPYWLAELGPMFFEVKKDLQTRGVGLSRLQKELDLARS
jgi:hypothetical protein